MKKILTIVLILVFTVFSLYAFDDLDDDDGFYSFSNITTGYGAVYNSNSGLINSIDLGFSFNFAGMDDTRSFGIGLGTRCDVLFGAGNNRRFIGVDCLIGPFFNFRLNKPGKNEIFITANTRIFDY